eukprot:TRINITY_DN23261_c0_g1_i1.p4 TRINITY_DN23261_c0_g1~~TRINITY_DN23261_c0_g1_i1.p4  ORF type:complete len:179 (+),score=1.35 TRINITY_DN23261_c0_g1_i1:3-539(+)
MLEKLVDKLKYKNDGDSFEIIRRLLEVFGQLVQDGLQALFKSPSCELVQNIIFLLDKVSRLAISNVKGSRGPEECIRIIQECLVLLKAVYKNPDGQAHFGSAIFCMPKSADIIKEVAWKLDYIKEDELCCESYCEEWVLQYVPQARVVSIEQCQKLCKPFVERISRVSQQCQTTRKVQ